MSTPTECAQWCQDNDQHRLADHCYAHTDPVGLTTDIVDLDRDGVTRRELVASLWTYEGEPSVELDYSGERAGRLTLDEAREFHAHLSWLLELAGAR